LALWLVGRGIAPIFNRRACPTQNAKGERCHGRIGSGGDPEHCPHFAAWQPQVEWVVKTQRERYPSVAGKSRRAAYPELAHRGRAYAAAREGEYLALERVEAYLAAGRWPRWVSKVGQVWLYGKAYRVKRAWAKQQVWVRYEPTTHEGVIQAPDGPELARHAATVISAPTICQLRVSHPRPPSRKKRHNSTAEPGA
jgi:hypothetical protein